MSFKALAYPNFIGKGYHNCLTCHYNPFGAGPLNDYGRGVAASALAGRLFVSDSTTDEQLGQSSGFLFNKQDKQFLKPALDYRGANIYSSLETDESQERWVNMQMDATLSAVFGAKKQFIVTYTHSMVPSNSLPSGKAEYEVAAGEDLTYSREHYIGWKLKPNLGIYLGKMDKVFGIRVPDHTSYSRLKTGNDQYGSVHGAVFHYGQQSFDFGGQYYIGDLEKAQEYQMSGFSTKLEYSITDNIRIGGSYLSESSDDLERGAMALLAKAGVGKGSSVMFEVGQVSNTPTGSDTTAEQYLFLQNHFYIFRGFYFVTTYEQSIPDTSSTNEIHRIAPGILYFPVQRIELRADLYNTKEYTTGTATKDSWSFIGQIHLWF
tara:strand:+ start:953 stop:2083 length:1131 start_codon:yes stop_codon:yes gene_type:complete